MLCPSCQTANLPDAEFCDTCGLQLRQRRAVPLPAQPPVIAAPAGRRCPSCQHAVASDDALCFHCGTPLPKAPAPSLILEIGSQRIPYAGHELLFGRTDARTRVKPDVEVHDAAVSRRHLAIWWDDAQHSYCAQDLESGNGTRRNGEPMEPGVPTPLGPGDVLQIGTTWQMHVRIG